MIFNSYVFYVFIVCVFMTYWLFQTKNQRNLWLLVASYFFYGFWDWRFLGLIIASSSVDYIIGIRLGEVKISQKKALVLLSIIFNLGLLGFFKYHNFFIDSMKKLLQSFGYSLEYSTLEIILPVGISFYTFQTLSYTLDIYRGRIKPTKDIISFFAFVSFFPQLVAGPIERASHLLPQFYRTHVFNYAWAVEGSRLILWGLFKKVIIADNLAYRVDYAFDNYETKAAWVLYETLVFFAFQIYCDFSGYSDIARGVARWFGFDIMRNFNRPYNATSFRDFWSRWHISLSTWFRDYVYIPLGGSKNGSVSHLVNLTITFLLSGLWHGANWTYMFWGLLHSAFYIPETLLRKFKPNLAKFGPVWVKKVLIFHMVLLAWAYFRAPSISHANGFLLYMIEGIVLHPGSILFFKWYYEVGLVIGLLVLEYSMGEKEHPFDIKNKLMRWSLYIISILLILIFQSYHHSKSFIYFQF